MFELCMKKCANLTNAPHRFRAVLRDAEREIERQLAARARVPGGEYWRL